MATPQPMAQPQQPPAPKGASSLALVLIISLSALIVALIYVFIFFVSGVSETSKYWWCGLTSFIFAFIFYMVHAAIKEEPVTRIISGVFFALGAVFFYGSILVGVTDPGWLITWLIVLSLIVIIVLVFVWRMSAQREADEARKAARHRTP